MRVMARVVLTAALVCFVVARAPASAIIGATEPTQIMNNIQLVEAYAKQLQQLKYAIDSARSLKQQLKQLDPRTLDGLSSQSLNDLRDLNNLGEKIDSALHSSEDSLDVFRRAVRDMDATRMTPSEYLAKRAELAQISDGAEAQSYKADQATLRRLQSDSAELQVAANQAHGVSSNIQGFQQLIGSNVRVQSQLIQLNSTIARANMVAKQRVDREKAKDDLEIASKKAYFDQRSKALEQASKTKFILPSTSKYADPGNH